MELIHSTTRTRRTEATKRRDNNVRLLLDTLACGPMLRDDMRDMLNLSASGINKYINLLREAEVIELERYVEPTKFSLGHPLYCLARDSDVVAEYLRALEYTPTELPAPKRHIHRLKDDGPWLDRLPKLNIPAPDPVLAAFFGLAQPTA